MFSSPTPYTQDDHVFYLNPNPDFPVTNIGREKKDRDPVREIA